MKEDEAAILQDAIGHVLASACSRAESIRLAARVLVHCYGDILTSIALIIKVTGVAVSFSLILFDAQPIERIDQVVYFENVRVVVRMREDTVNHRSAQNLDRDNYASSTMGTFQSLTVHCARGHNHKSDPVSQCEYYPLPGLC